LLTKNDNRTNNKTTNTSVAVTIVVAKEDNRNEL